MIRTDYRSWQVNNIMLQMNEAHTRGRVGGSIKLSDVMKMLDCSKSTAWRVMNYAVERGVFEKEYLQSGLNVVCVFRMTPIYEAAFLPRVNQ